MEKPYRTDELCLALGGIAFYTAAGVFGAHLNRIAGAGELPRMGLFLLLSLLLLAFVVRMGRSERYGLRKPESAARLLRFVPLALLALSNLGYGVVLPDAVHDVLYAVLLAVSVAFLEELLFRGFLFKALEPKNAEAAAIVSSAVFGLLHLLRLFDGAPLPSVLCQTVLAAAIGYLFVTVFRISKSLLPCIAAHAAFDLGGACAPEASVARLLVLTSAQLLLAVAFTVYAKRTR